MTIPTYNHPANHRNVDPYLDIPELDQEDQTDCGDHGLFANIVSWLRSEFRDPPQNLVGKPTVAEEQILKRLEPRLGGHSRSNSGSESSQSSSSSRRPTSTQVFGDNRRLPVKRHLNYFSQA